MKTKTLLLAALLTLPGYTTTQAAILTYDTGFANAGIIPDGNASGWSDPRTVSGLAGQITQVTVTLDLTGGWNGDLYAYLAHGSELTVLLNRVGVGSGNPFGYSDSGLQVTFDDHAAGDIHQYGAGVITGGAAWQPDGRTISPSAAAASFDGASRSGLSAFNSLNPNGDWTLFVADLSGGGGLSQVTTWGLDITTAPVPVTETGLGLVAVLGTWALLVGHGGRLRPRAPARRNAAARGGEPATGNDLRAAGRFVRPKAPRPAPGWPVAQPSGPMAC